MGHKEMSQKVLNRIASTEAIPQISRQESAEGIVVNARSNARFMAKA